MRNICGDHNLNIGCCFQLVTTCSCLLTVHTKTCYQLLLKLRIKKKLKLENIKIKDIIKIDQINLALLILFESLYNRGYSGFPQHLQCHVRAT